jgi:PadR family transcriptional regulator
MESERELLKGNTPTLVLAVLREGPRHGYAIAREIERRSGSVLKCKEGTLYPALHSLEREGLVAGEWQIGEGERPRKVYSLTPSGMAALAERTRTWERFAAAVGRVIAGDTNDAPEERSQSRGGRDAFPLPRPEPTG